MITSELIDPYPPITNFPDDWSHEYPEHWLEDDSGPRCLCEGDGWLPTIDGGAIECHGCTVGEY